MTDLATDLATRLGRILGTDLGGGGGGPTPPSDPPEYVSGNGFLVGSVNPVTFDNPGSVADGDTLVFVLFQFSTFNANRAGGITMPAGFSVAFEGPAGDDGYTVFTKIATASEPATYDFTLTASSLNAGAATCYRNVTGIGDAAALIDFNPYSWQAPSISLDNANSIMFVCANVNQSEAGDYTEEQSERASGGNLVVCDDSPGGTGPTGVRMGPGSGTYYTISLALEGSGGGVPIVHPKFPLRQGQWTNISPSGMSFYPGDFMTQGIGICDGTPSVIYACLCHQSTDPLTGMYVSSDSGATWEQTSGQAMGGPEFSVQVCVHPTDPDRAVVAAGVRGDASRQGYFRTSDRGQTWERPATWVAAASGSGTVDAYNIHCSPGNFDVQVMAPHSNWTGGGTGVWLTLDGGNTWSAIPCDPAITSAGNNVHILYHPDSGTGNEQTWLLGTQGNGHWRTTDSGATWTQVSTSDMSHGGQQIWYAPDGTLYVACQDGILRSTDNGATFTSMGFGQSTYAVQGTADGSYWTARAGGNAPVLGAAVSDPGVFDRRLTSKLWDDSSGSFCFAYDQTNGILYNAAYRDGFWAYKF